MKYEGLAFAPRQSAVASRSPRTPVDVMCVRIEVLEPLAAAHAASAVAGGRGRSCPQAQREILTFGCTELILTHDKLLSMPQVTLILINMYIIHNE